MALVYQLLPVQVASHFGSNGFANGWMMKDEYLIVMIVVSAVWTIIMLLFDFFVFMLPVSVFSIPNAAYWKLPENQPLLRRKTSRCLYEVGIYIIVLLAAVNYLTLQANTKKPPQLDNIEVVLVILFGLIMLWIVRIFIMFRIPKNNKETDNTL
jgi:uncharacterized membrane protein